REEIFFNELLAQDEITQLLEPKVLTNAKRIDKDGEKPLDQFNRNESGTITDNLIIKGNNLLALHTLKEEFAGKIKLIYIDPPYNTGGDNNIFSYNNTFNHSTWLTFMKNRLVEARTFLKNDGFITIAIDHYELYYLGCLCDEIFGRENRIAIVTVVHNPKGRNQAKFFSENSEYLLVYAKNIQQANFNQVAIDEDVLATFDMEDEKGKYRYEPFIRARTVWSRENRPKNWYPIYVSDDLKSITSEKTDGYFELYPQTNSGDFAWKNIKESFNELNTNNYFKAELENGKVTLYHKYYEQQVFKNVWTDKKYQSEFHGTNLLKRLIGTNNFSYPKSLYAVIDVLKIMSNPGDIILDFFGGSGTTMHAVLELNTDDNVYKRQFIVIEQLQEHIDILLKRGQKIITDSLDSFTYLELKKYNQTFIEQIEEAKDSK
ncbi:site-specific DNA-methyltransferase, partial [Flavobacterium filum]|uniref:site-specific DNA-methyltransferase n=1 Tax=Flavobacterium filum TaxID=370974 RepID=UPI0023EFD13C